MPALVGWRRRTLSLAASPVWNDEAGPRAPIAAPRPSTWSRWWSRNRTTSDIKESEKRVTPSGPGKVQVARPSLEYTESAPIKIVSGVCRPLC